MISADDIRKETPAFHAYMAAVDDRMRLGGVPIPNRELEFMRELGKDGIRMVRGCGFNEDLWGPIDRWFEHRYGDRLKIDMSLGRGILLVRGTRPVRHQTSAHLWSLERRLRGRKDTGDHTRTLRIDG